MFSRLKEAITKTNEEQTDKHKRSQDFSLLSPKELQEYKKTVSDTKQCLEEISSIVQENKTDIKLYIKQQKQQKNTQKASSNEGDEQYTFEEDLEEVKTLLSDVVINLSKLQQSNEEIKDRVKSVSQPETPEKTKELQEMIKKYQAELKSRLASQQNNKEILSTLKQQTQLLSKQTKELQDKCMKLEKEVNQKTSLVNNLQEEKKVLLELCNNQSKAVNPEIELLKGHLQQADKKLTIERTKLQQKEKEIETLKKKMEEDRDSLEKIADELKEKELKSKKILDKYERSKTEIRKYREEKTEFIKKLNLEIASLTEKADKLYAQNQQLKTELKQITEKAESLEGQLTKNQGKNADLQSARTELKLVRQQQIEMTSKLSQKEQQNSQLKSQVEQLQNKRKSLLQALEKPVNHQIKTLDKIIRALEKLYKEYIEVVFTQGNIIGFQNKIQYILSNVCDIKEDLKL